MTPCRCSVCQADRWALRLLGFVAGLLVAYLLWGVIAVAASRSAPPSGLPLASSAVRGGQSGAPLGALNGRLSDEERGRPATFTPLVRGAPTPTATVDGPPAPSANPRQVTPTLGVASWYDDGPGDYAAAGPRLRRGAWRNSHVVITGFHDGRAWPVTVALTDWCQCYRATSRERLIDLSPDVFLVVCGPLGRGLCKVQVEVLR